MIQNTIHTILRRRHFWRFANFSEVAQLYMVKLMRTVAVFIGASFMSVYMYKTGYSLIQVSLFWAGYFLAKAIFALPYAQLIAYIGPKKAILISNLLYIPSMLIFTTLPEFGVPALILTALFQSNSTALYDIGYLVNFSRIKDLNKAGHEVALMNMLEKIAKGVSPLIGGLLAMLVDPRASILVSAVLFLFAAWPLMQTPDSMPVGFHLALRRFPWRAVWRSLVAQFSVGFDYYASGNAWSLFLASVIFTASNNQVYAEMGALASLVLFVSLAAAHLYGKLIDHRAGKQLLFWSSMGTMAVHLLRATAKTPVPVITANAAYEVSSTGYLMAFMRGMFDTADRSGYRVLYVGLAQLMANVGAAISSLLLAALILLLDPSAGFSIFYIITAIFVAIIPLVKFRLYH